MIFFEKIHLSYSVCKSFSVWPLKWVGFLLIIALTGCASRLYEGDGKYHQIAANTNGNYLALYQRSDIGQCGLNQHLDKIVARVKEQSKIKMAKQKYWFQYMGD